jgi:dTDP-4-dehydrorhamnose 3,5-epimerase
LNGILLISPKIYKDSRGFFFESYNQKRFEKFDIPNHFVQDNFSMSTKNTIRGLHYQVNKFAQGKLGQVLKGRVLDVSVDIRFGSPTFGKYFSIELSEENHLQVYIPVGFAHGFSVLSDEALFHYKCSAYYSKENEKCILYNDKDLNIDWKVDLPIVSEKDETGIKFKDLPKEFVF